MTETLKPCPFCGGKPYVHINDPVSDGRERTYIGCQKCYIKNPFTPLNNTVSSARLSWNTRADSAVDVIRGLTKCLSAHTRSRFQDGDVEALTEGFTWLSQHAQDKPMEDK